MVCIATFINPSEAVESNNDSRLVDEKLTAQIQNAVLKKVEAEKVEDFVGVKAAFSTVAKDTNDSFDTIEVNYFKGLVAPVRSERKFVLYWIMKTPSKNPMILGIFYLINGKLILFSGEILPPG
jgi:hypothetical protein